MGVEVVAVGYPAGVLLRVIDSLTPQEWAADSAARGWTVHDVVAHMSSAQWCDSSDLASCLDSRSQVLSGRSAHLLKLKTRGVQSGDSLSEIS